MTCVIRWEETWIECRLIDSFTKYSFLESFSLITKMSHHKRGKCFAKNFNWSFEPQTPLNAFKELKWKKSINRIKKLLPVSRSTIKLQFFFVSFIFASLQFEFVQFRLDYIFWYYVSRIFYKILSAGLRLSKCWSVISIRRCIFSIRSRWTYRM